MVFSWVVFESREHRDQVNARIVADPRLKEIGDPNVQPFNCKRMAYDGFRTLVHL